MGASLGRSRCQHFGKIHRMPTTGHQKKGCFVSSWQFPEGDVPLWVRNAMEAAEIDITGVCNVRSRDLEITNG